MLPSTGLPALLSTPVRLVSEDLALYAPAATVAAVMLALAATLVVLAVRRRDLD